MTRSFWRTNTSNNLVKSFKSVLKFGIASLNSIGVIICLTLQQLAYDNWIVNRWQQLLQRNCCCYFAVQIRHDECWKHQNRIWMALKACLSAIKLRSSWTLLQVSSAALWRVVLVNNSNDASVTVLKWSNQLLCAKHLTCFFILIGEFFVTCSLPTLWVRRRLVYVNVK